MLNIETSIYDDQGIKETKETKEILKKQLNYSRCHGIVLYNEEDSNIHLVRQ